MVKDDPFAQLADQMENIIAVVAGYRKKLIGADFSVDEATAMAVELHRILLKTCFTEEQT